MENLEFEKIKDTITKVVCVVDRNEKGEMMGTHYERRFTHDITMNDGTIYVKGDKCTWT